MLLQSAARLEEAVGAGDTLTVDSTGRLAALGVRREIWIVDLEWPWEPCRVLPTPELAPPVALEWQPQRGAGSGRTIACASADGALRLYDGAAEPGALSLLVTLCGRAAGGGWQGPRDCAVQHVAWRPAAPHTLAAATAGGGLAFFDCRAGSAWHLAMCEGGGGGGGPSASDGGGAGRVSWCGGPADAGGAAPSGGWLAPAELTDRRRRN